MIDWFSDVLDLEILDGDTDQEEAGEGGGGEQEEEEEDVEDLDQDKVCNHPFRSVT